MKILLSAGHGGADVGSIGADRGYEKNRTLTLTNKVASYLKSAGHSVTVRQEKDANGDWSMTNRKGYDYALSIHFNAFKNGQAKGTECFYKGTPKKAGDLSSKVAGVLGTTNRGAKNNSGLYMMNIGFDNLIEVCFHDNKSDLDKYNANIDKVAKTIADVVNGSSTPSSGGSSSSSSSSNDNVTGDITYQSYDNTKDNWLPEVVNYDDYAGNDGNPMGGVRAKCENGEIKIQSRTLNGAWLGWISSKDYKKNDKDNGNSYSGIYNKPLDAVRIVSTKGYVTYQVKTLESGWLPEVDSRDALKGGVDSYAGNFGETITCIRMK